MKGGGGKKERGRARGGGEEKSPGQAEFEPTYIYVGGHCSNHVRHHLSLVAVST